MFFIQIEEASSISFTVVAPTEACRPGWTSRWAAGPASHRGWFQVELRFIMEVVGPGLHNTEAAAAPLALALWLLRHPRDIRDASTKLLRVDQLDSAAGQEVPNARDPEFM